MRADDQPARIGARTPEFGHSRDALRTEDKKVHAAPPESVERALSCSSYRGLRRPTAICSSWATAQPALDELVAERAPRTPPIRKGNEALIDSKEAAGLGTVDGDRVRVSRVRCRRSRRRPSVHRRRRGASS